MNLHNAQTAVENWMIQFGQEVPGKPVIPSAEIRQLRAKLIFEEALETVKALGFSTYVLGNRIRMENVEWIEEDAGPDLTAIQDGCSDLHVVTLGTEAACGLDAEPAFNEVMRSNFSKMWTDEEVANRFCGGNLGAVASPIGFRISVDFGQFSAVRVAPSQETRCWLVKNASGKVLKSPSYSAANLQPIIEAQQPIKDGERRG